jgi:hypothetical protein
LFYFASSKMPIKACYIRATGVTLARIAGSIIT